MMNDLSQEKQLAAVRASRFAILYIKNPSEAVQLAAVKNNGYAIQYIKNPSEKVQLAAVKISGFVIQYIENPSEKVQLAAVSQIGRALRYIKNPSEKVKQIASKNMYPVSFLEDGQVRVGCQVHTVEEWLSFTEDEIEAMDGEYSLSFYPHLVKILKKHKEAL